MDFRATKPSGLSVIGLSDFFSTSARISSSGRVFSTASGVSHARRATCTPQRMLPSAITNVRRSKSTIVAPRSCALRANESLKSSRSG